MLVAQGEIRRVINLSIYLVLLIQIFSTCYILVGKIDHEIDWISSLNKYQDTSEWNIYVQAVFFIIYSISTVGYGDSTGKNHYEIAVSLGILICGGMYYSYFLGIMSNMFSTIAYC
jgi:hypothetical protein